MKYHLNIGPTWADYRKIPAPIWAELLSHSLTTMSHDFASRRKKIAGISVGNLFLVLSMRITLQP